MEKAINGRPCATTARSAIGRFPHTSHLSRLINPTHYREGDKNRLTPEQRAGALFHLNEYLVSPHHQGDSPRATAIATIYEAYIKLLFIASLNLARFLAGAGWSRVETSGSRHTKARYKWSA